MCLALAVSMSACVFKHIPDTNGDDDFTVVTITDDAILNGPSNSLSNLKVMSHVGFTTTLKIDKFSGVDQLEVIRVTSDSKTITTEMTVSSGNCRLVLMDDKQILYDFDINGTDSYTLEVGKYRLKLVGESAKVDLLKYTIA